MKNVPRGFDNVDAIKSDGTVVTAVRNGANKGCTLGVATYYFPIGGEQSELITSMPYASAHIQGDAVVVAAITLETTDFPRFELGMENGIVDIDNHVSTAGAWVPCNPAAAVVDVTGAGWVANAGTVNVAGGAAGAAMYNIGNLGGRRARIKIVVTTGGLVRVGVHGKMAA